MTVRPVVRPCVYPCVWDVTSYGGADTADPAFRFEVKTTATPEVFTLPTYNGGIYDFHIDYGDGTEYDIATWNDVNNSHSYATPGTYNVAITGTMSGWQFANGGSKDLIYDVSNWGAFNPIAPAGAQFHGCSNLTVSATDIFDFTGVTSFLNGFRNCTSLVSIPGLAGADSTSLATMQNCFYGDTSFDQNLGSMNISSLSNATLMLGLATMSTENWSNTLIGWQAQAHLDTVVLGGGSSKYNTAGGVARGLLGGDGWTITDGGAA